MQQPLDDRRQVHDNATFPLIDDNGNKVVYERRSGRDRRKDRRGCDVARNIINILH